MYFNQSFTYKIYSLIQNIEIGIISQKHKTSTSLKLKKQMKIGKQTYNAKIDQNDEMPTKMTKSN